MGTEDITNILGPGRGVLLTFKNTYLVSSRGVKLGLGLGKAGFRK